jgi:act minimal PKS chain-length factor (CLF/KS beta)
VPVTAPKTMIGRLPAGGSPVDVVTTVLAMREGLIPPAIDVGTGTAGDLDLIAGWSRTASVRTAIVPARGHGGFNSAVVLRAVD